MKNLLCPFQTGSVPVAEFTISNYASKKFVKIKQSWNHASFACMVAAMMLFFGSSTGWGNVATFSTAGNHTWTCPPGVTSVEVECWGGGGGGGGAGAEYNAAGGAAGGSYVQVATMSVTSGTVYNLTVGAGGTGGTTVSNSSNPSVDNGGIGGSSFFGNSVAGNSSDAQVLAVGGMGGNGNVTPNGVTGARWGGAAGGVASNTGNLPASPTVNNAGTSGGTSLPLSGTGTSSQTSSGAGGAGAGAAGSNAGGAGGAAKTSGGTAGNPGVAPGGGGSGGYQAGQVNTGPGGAGGAGEVQITYAGIESIYSVLPGQSFTSGSGLSGAPSSQIAGTAFTVTLYYVEPDGVTVDTSKNGTFNITITGPVTGTFSPSSSTAVTFSAGTGTINVTLNDATSTTLSSTDGTVAGNTSGAVTVTAGAGAQLQVLMPGETAAPGTATGKTGMPAGQITGTSLNVTVNAVDTYWNLVSSTRRIFFTSSDTNAVIPASDPLVGGQKIFTMTFKTAGIWMITATDTNATPFATGIGSSVTVSPGTAAQLQVLMPGETSAPGTATGKYGTPNAQNAGAPFSVTVNAVDANWNLISTDMDTVAITSSDSSAILPANAALVAGTKMFNVTFETGGSQTITAMDQSSSPLNPNTGSATTVNTPASIPIITGFGLSGGTLTFSGTNGSAGASYGILESTNIALPLAQWTPILLNAQFDGSGNLNTSLQLSSTLDPNAPQQFFIIKTPSP
jgi:hypothetical protein